jgi:hypothetical protein
MFGELNTSLLVVLGGVTVVVVFLVLRSLFNEEARLRRRRERNYGPTVSKGKGPMVKLAVKTDERKGQ